jgi:hypothetical protein
MCAEYHHAFYLATHIVYAIGAYSVVKTSERDVPWLYKYCRQSMRFWMRRARQKAKLGGHQGGGKVGRIICHDDGRRTKNY